MISAEIGCVVLASGLSRRFGAADKLSADLCGKPVLSHVLETAKTAGFGEVFCVTQSTSTQNVDGVTPIENDNPEAGQGHALRLGLRALRGKGWANGVILLGDMPLVSASYLQNMVLNSTENQSCISISESIRLPPALFNSAAIDQILSQNSVKGARAVFVDLDIVTVELDEVAALDVDTPQDLARVSDIMKARRT